MQNRPGELDRVTGTEPPDHTCERPSWSCRACGQPWPCPPARTSLTDGADRVMLAMYMWGQLDRAMTDLSPLAPAEFYDRFLGWTGTKMI